MCIVNSSLLETDRDFLSQLIGREELWRGGYDHGTGGPATMQLKMLITARKKERRTNEILCKNEVYFLLSHKGDHLFCICTARSDRKPACGRLAFRRKTIIVYETLMRGLLMTTTLTPT